MIKNVVFCMASSFLIEKNGTESYIRRTQHMGGKWMAASKVKVSKFFSFFYKNK